MQTNVYRGNLFTILIIHVVIMLGLFFSDPIAASPQRDYLARFQQYLAWSQALPVHPQADFLSFIEADKPLSNKLRERWLYQLADQKNWTDFLRYYKPSRQLSLNCYAEYAHYMRNQREAALNASQSIWLNGTSLPAACNALFDLMRQDPKFDLQFIDARIILALNQNNPQLANYLLGLYHPPKKQDQTLLNQISKTPTVIPTLPTDRFHGYFYVFGLKRLVRQNPLKAIQLYKQALSENRLSHAQKQQFLTTLALYKSIKQERDAVMWFNQIDPAFYNDPLLETQIRLAIKHNNWPVIERLIHHLQTKNDPCWQYWLARALEEQGQTKPAHELYQQLSQTRQYYGFLASVRLHQSFHFADEKSEPNRQLIADYQPFIDQLLTLDQRHQPIEILKLLNDFITELPKAEKVSLLYWIARTFNWYGLSIELCTQEDLKNQLDLRFPLAYQNEILSNSNTFHLPAALVYAIIRQESSFKHDIISPAGARGLMQLMPTTASMIAKRHHLTYHHQNDLFQSQTNISLGTAYLSFLAKHFKNHPLFMIAAYNAGPRQVLRWLKNHPTLAMDSWIETIPWQETRNYIKNVIAFYAVYQYQLKQPISLEPMMQPIPS